MERDDPRLKFANQQLIAEPERRRRLAAVYRLLIQIASREAMVPRQDKPSSTSSTLSDE